MISVHDNIVYACSIDFENQRLTLHTQFLDKLPYEYTDTVFRGVVAHEFEHGLPANILFDVSEVTAESLVDDNAAVFLESWRYGWPPLEYQGDLDVLKSLLRSQGLVGFSVHSSYGLNGWILCKTCERISRNGKAVVA